MRMHNPPHPGRIIREALADILITVTAFAAHIGVSRVALSRLLNEKAAVTPKCPSRSARPSLRMPPTSRSTFITITTSSTPPKPTASRFNPSNPPPPDHLSRCLETSRGRNLQLLC